jgi:phosphatidylserine/phosphatidylglycerophosphate/cardiolipin synthase-like enzyme
MTDPITAPERTEIGLNNRREVNLTMPWFVPKSKYPPRHGNVLLPLINGERAFASVHAAISAARKSIDIISWGFDPSMRLMRPNGSRVGDLLKARAKAGVEVRVLAWKNAIANFEENNIIGDGFAGSGGGSAGTGSGIGSTAPRDAKGAAVEHNAYGSKRSGPGSAGVRFDDPDAKAYNRQWFKEVGKGLSFRTRDFGGSDRQAIIGGHIERHGRFTGLKQRIGLGQFVTHHQKVILVDYETPDVAVGFVMGHNMLRDYWDDDEHAYWSDARLGFAPWQDLSSCVFGPVLWDLNENFCTAWTKAQPWIGSDQPIGAQRLQIKPDVFVGPAAKRGAPEPARSRARRCKRPTKAFSSPTGWRWPIHATTSTLKTNTSAAKSWRCICARPAAIFGPGAARPS